MSWFFLNTKDEFTEEHIGEAFGFVYMITHLKTGRKYIGKKFFTKSKTRQVKGKKKRSRVSSDWMTYWGSNKKLQEEVKEMEKTSISERYYTSVKLGVNVRIGRPGRYSVVML